MQKENKFQTSRKTIGVLINHVEGIFQTPICQGISHYAAKHDINVFYFTGKALNSPNTEDNLQNVIYSLANPDKLDGLIVSTGTIAHHHTNDEILEFFRSFPGIPIVSISNALKGIPSVIIDNTGMTSMLNHLIEVHGYRSIAFIKGCCNNKDAIERFDAYQKSLEAHGIPFDPTLVYEGDFRYQSGQAALKAIEERGGQVDVIVSSNDEMALAVYQTLEKRGVRIPEQMAVTGFDDFDNASQLFSPLTTVHQPLYEMAWTAFDTLCSMMRGEKVPEITTMPERLMVRESCGCYPLAATEKFDSIIISATDHNPLEMKSSIPLSLDLLAGLIISHVDFSAQNSSLDKTTIERDLTSLLQSLDFDITVKNKKTMSLLVLTEILKYHMACHEDISFWQQIFAITRKLFIDRFNTIEQTEIINDIFERSQIILGDLMQRSKAGREIQLNDLMWKMRDFITLFNNAFDIQSLSKGLYNHLPELGIKRGYLALYSKASDLKPSADFILPLNSDLIVAFDERGPLVTADEPCPFLTKHILPASITEEAYRYSLIFIPLLNSKVQFGYLALDTGDIEPIAYDILREQISNGLFTISLFNQLKNKQVQK